MLLNKSDQAKLLDLTTTGTALNSCARAITLTGSASAHFDQERFEVTLPPESLVVLRVAK